MNRDIIGLFASSLCAIHCALLPFVATLLPLLGLQFLAYPQVELTMVLFSVIIGVASLLPSYRKHHFDKKPLILFAAGFLLIAVAHLSEIHELEPILGPLGALGIAASHYVNWKLSKPYHVLQPKVPEAD